MTSFSSTVISNELVQAFREAGFVDVIYDGQEGIFLKKSLLCGDMPDVCSSLVDGDTLLNESTCYVEIIPNGELQLYIPDIDYVERYNIREHSVDYLALAKEAGVKWDTTGLPLWKP